jgi:hypothetical protein
MREHGPRPTLGELQRATPWVWLWCERCQHHGPLACAVAVILWGPDASSDKLRAGARCTSSGSKGATVQHQGGQAVILAFSRFQLLSSTSDLIRADVRAYTLDAAQALADREGINNG